MKIQVRKFGIKLVAVVFIMNTMGISSVVLAADNQIQSSGVKQLLTNYLTEKISAEALAEQIITADSKNAASNLRELQKQVFEISSSLTDRERVKLYELRDIMANTAVKSENRNSKIKTAIIVAGGVVGAVGSAAILSKAGSDGYRSSGDLGFGILADLIGGAIRLSFGSVIGGVAGAGAAKVVTSQIPSLNDIEPKNANLDVPKK
ncbi:MAG: hypothetical protein SGI74_05300 [Oligoflexia bacterium]|nr:hypothetical protein [Oligoflexia bacterium]